jgi:hypothetical protein
MIKNPITLAVAALAVLTTIAMTALSPVSASSAYSASTGYLPEQIVNHGTAVESTPADAFGDTGLSKTFPKEDPASQLDATPEMYS